jgi:hypothetical protein
VKWFWKKSKAVSDRALAPMSAEEQRLTELAEAELAGNLLPDGTVLDDLPAGAGDWTLRGPFALGMKEILNPGHFLGRTSDDYSSQRDANTGK